MGWVILRVVAHKLQEAYIDLIMSVLFTLADIGVALLFWRAIVNVTTATWTEDMIIAFVLFLELAYSWTYIVERALRLSSDYVMGSLVTHLTKPRWMWYRFAMEIPGEEVAAAVIKTAIFVPILAGIGPSWGIALIAFVLAVFLEGGITLGLSGLTMLLGGREGVKILYDVLWGWGSNVPADFYGGVFRLLFKYVIPVYFVATFPTKALFGSTADFFVLIVLAVVWWLAGIILTKAALRRFEGYGG